MISRTSPLSRYAPKRKRGKPRRGRVVDKAMLAFIHTQPCLLSLRNPDTHRCNGRLTAHHVRKFGSGRDDTRTIPLCVGAHLHDGSAVSIERLGKSKFERFHDVDLEKELIRYQELFALETSK